MKFRIAFTQLFVGLLMASCQSQPEQSTSKLLTADSLQNKTWLFEKTASWSDEFDNSGKPDSTKWSYDIGGSGWGNHELQYYTNRIENASVSDGILSITAQKENFSDKEYTSARLVTKNKGDFLYGRIEVRAKVPAGIGTWPAIWMLPTDWEYGGWPESGEIDIMEHVGYDPNNIHFSTHCKAYYWRQNNHKTATKIIPTAITDFHVYSVEWTPQTIRGYIDDQLIFTNTNEKKGFESWPFDKRFHLILNLAVGGDWGGKQGVDEQAFPASMLVDYVRFYKVIPQ